MPVDELGPPEVLDEPVRGGELDPERAFDALGIGGNGFHGGQDGAHRWSPVAATIRL